MDLFICIGVVIGLYCVALTLHVLYKKTGEEKIERLSLQIEWFADQAGKVTAITIIIAFIFMLIKSL